MEQIVLRYHNEVMGNQQILTPNKKSDYAQGKGKQIFWTASSDMKIQLPLHSLAVVQQ